MSESQSYNRVAVQLIIYKYNRETHAAALKELLSNFALIIRNQLACNFGLL